MRTGQTDRFSTGTGAYTSTLRVSETLRVALTLDGHLLDHVLDQRADGVIPRHRRLDRTILDPLIDVAVCRSGLREVGKALESLHLIHRGVHGALAHGHVVRRGGPGGGVVGLGEPLHE